MKNHIAVEVLNEVHMGSKTAFSEEWGAIEVYDIDSEWPMPTEQALAEEEHERWRVAETMARRDEGESELAYARDGDVARAAGACPHA